MDITHISELGEDHPGAIEAQQHVGPLDVQVEHATAGVQEVQGPSHLGKIDR